MSAKAGPGRTTARVDAIDAARTAALANMVAFHFLYDLLVLGFRAEAYGSWFLPWAKGIAGSFLLLAGASLWLAHGRGTRWRGFWWRFGQLAGAAAAVSAATYVAMPDVWVRFGILHSIAAASLIGVACLRLPWPAIAGLGLAFLWGRDPLRAALDGVEGALGLVTGLAWTVPPMMDYEPILPWAAPLLFGLAGAKALDAAWPRLARIDLPGWTTWPGRHSLAIYLLHQPVLFGGLMAVRWATG